MANPNNIFVTRGGGNTDPARDGTAVAATVYSEVWSGEDADGHGLHLEWTGTATGNLQLWMSDKPAPGLANDNDWVQDTLFGTAGNVPLGGAAGKFRDDAGNAKSRWKRVKLSSGAGSGTLFGWVTVPRTR